MWRLPLWCRTVEYNVTGSYVTQTAIVVEDSRKRGGRGEGGKECGDGGRGRGGAFSRLSIRVGQGDWKKLRFYLDVVGCVAKGLGDG